MISLRDDFMVVPAGAVHENFWPKCKAARKKVSADHFCSRLSLESCAKREMMSLRASVRNDDNAEEPLTWLERKNMRIRR